MQFYHHQTIGSTNEEAKRLIVDENLRDLPFAIRADIQTAGKGRLERNWVSQEGNFFLSYAETYPGDPEKLPLFAFVVALAVRNTLARYIDVSVLRFKWPNDVLLKGKKLCGILTEVIHLDGQAFVITGVGINIASAPSDVQYPATFLQEGGSVDIDLDQLAEQWVTEYQDLIQTWQAEGFETIREQWLANAHEIGSEVAISSGETKLHGKFKGLNPTGAIIIETGDGQQQEVYAGDVLSA